MQCFEILPLRLPSTTETDTLGGSCSDAPRAVEETEQLLSAHLLHGDFCLLEKACPSCNIPLVKRLAAATTTASSLLPLRPSPPPPSSLAGVAYCVKCQAHIVGNTADFQLVQEYSMSHHIGSIYFLSDDSLVEDSLLEGEEEDEEGDHTATTTSKEDTIGTTTVVTQSVGTASRSSTGGTSGEFDDDDDEYDDSLKSTSYQMEEIEVVLAQTEDGGDVDDIDDDDDDDDDDDVDHRRDETLGNGNHDHNDDDCPSPPPTRRISNMDPIPATLFTNHSSHNHNHETEAVVSSPRPSVELTWNDHQNFLQQPPPPPLYRGHSPRHDPAALQRRTVDLDEIEWTPGAGEDVSLLAIEENHHHCVVVPEITATTSHETAVEIAIQQSASRMNGGGLASHQMTTTKTRVDFPMPEFKVRREIAIKVLAGKMVQGYSIMDGQCDACLMPLMCDANGSRVTPCFVCRSIRKSHYKTLATRAVETQCWKTNDGGGDLMSRPVEHVATAAPVPEEEDHVHSAATTLEGETNAEHDSTVETDPMITGDTDALPERTIDIVEPSVEEIVHDNNDHADSEQQVANNDDTEQQVAHNDDTEHIANSVNIECLDEPQQENITNGTKTSEELAPALDVVNAPNGSRLERTDRCEPSIAVSHSDASMDLVKTAIRTRTQHGWTVLDQPCPTCTLPMMTDKSGTHEICIQCELTAVNDDDDDDATKRAVPFHTECPTEATPMVGTPIEMTDDIVFEEDDQNEVEDIKNVAEDENALYIEETHNDVTVDAGRPENNDTDTHNINPTNAEEEYMYDDSNLEEPREISDEVVSDVALPIDVECSTMNDNVIVLDSEQSNITELDLGEVDDVEMDNIPDHSTENVIVASDISDDADIPEFAEKMENDVIHVEATEPDFEEQVEDNAEKLDVVTGTEAIDAEKLFLEISESKSHDQPVKPTITGPFPWISSRASGSTSEKSVKPLDPPASNDPVVTDIFSRNSRRLGPPVGSRFRSNKSPDGFHRVDVRSCSPVRTLSPEIQQIESMADMDIGNGDNAFLPQTTIENETTIGNIIHLESPRVMNERDEGATKIFDDRKSLEDAIALNSSPSIEINQNFVRLEVPKTLSYTDRDAIVRLIEVATRTNDGDGKKDVSTELVGRRAASPGNSVANMPHSLSFARSYTTSAKSVSSGSRSSKMSNRINPPSPERHAVIDCTSATYSIPKRAPSPGLSEASNHRSISATSSVYSNGSSRASKNSRPKSEYSASAENRSERSKHFDRRRATPETTIRTKKPGLPSYIPGNPSRPYVTRSRSYQQTFASESTAFSRTKPHFTSNQSTGSAKSMPISNKTAYHRQGNHHVNSNLPCIASWRERRDEIILIDDTATDDRDNSIVDANKLDALLARIESTKSKLDNADEYRMRDLIVNLTRSAELLQKMEES